MTLVFLSFMWAACDSLETEETEKKPKEIKQMTFDAEMWKTKEGPYGSPQAHYPWRNHMYKDLMSNDSIRQLKKQHIRVLLGDPRQDRPDTNYLYYRITETKFGLWTLHTKTLVIKFKPDNSVEWMKIHE